ncbi:MAG: hypothetical protein COB02_16665 [Candidatus Cloacimonadota bacterium]|nr:MAG: hypothetical protein COB02_16665 [Candidatus Cloacimonadota bacterium]
MLFNRRNFIKNIGLSLGSLGLINTSYLEASITSQKKSKFIQNFYLQLHKWHCENFYDFDKQFHQIEKNYVKKCIELMDDWAYQVNENFVYSLASYSHHISKQGVNSSRISFGSYKFSEQLKPYLQEVLKLRSIPLNILDNKKAIGLGWDFETGAFKVYFHHENLSTINDNDLLSLKKQVTDSIYSNGLSSYSFHGNKLVEKKLYVALHEKLPQRFKQLFSKTDKISHTNLMVSSTRGVIPQMDLEQYNFKTLDQNGQRLFKEYKTTFGNQLDTISYNTKDSYTLYFPH